MACMTLEKLTTIQKNVHIENALRQSKLKMWPPIGSQITSIWKAFLPGVLCHFKIDSFAQKEYVYVGQYL